MRTTLDLPDDLLIEAKATAARRRITLRELFTRALERDLRPGSAPRADDHFLIDEDGWPVLKRDPESTVVVTSAFVRELMDKEGI
jgi:hypothetical protein